MKFFSKAASYTLVVRPATTVVHINGIPQTVPGEYIRFEDGIYKTDNQDTIKFLMENPAFGRDYVADVDSYQGTRKSIEPEHNINIMEFGHPTKSLTPLKNSQEEIQKIILAKATEIARTMVAEVLKQQAGMMKEVVKDPVATQVTPKVKKQVKKKEGPLLEEKDRAEIPIISSEQS